MVICGGTIFRSLHETLTYDLVSRIIMCGVEHIVYIICDSSLKFGVWIPLELQFWVI